MSPPSLPPFPASLPCLPSLTCRSRVTNISKPTSLPTDPSSPGLAVLSANSCTSEGLSPPRGRGASHHLMNTNPCGCVPAARSPGGLSLPPDTQIPPPGSLPVPRVPRRLAPAPPCRSPGTCPAQDPGPLHWPFPPPTCVPPHAFSA